MDNSDLVIECISRFTKETSFVPTTRLGEGLNLEALDVIEIVMDFERQSGTTIEDDCDYDDLLDMTVEQFTKWITKNAR